MQLFCLKAKNEMNAWHVSRPWKMLFRAGPFCCEKHYTKVSSRFCSSFGKICSSLPKYSIAGWTTKSRNLIILLEDRYLLACSWVFLLSMIFDNSYSHLHFFSLERFTLMFFFRILQMRSRKNLMNSDLARYFKYLFLARTRPGKCSKIRKVFSRIWSILAHH